MKTPDTAGEEVWPERLPEVGRRGHGGDAKHEGFGRGARRAGSKGMPGSMLKVTRRPAGTLG